MSVGRKLLTSLVDSEKGLDYFAKFRLSQELFAGLEEIQLYQHVAEHVRLYGKVPSRETLTELGAPTLFESVPEPPLFYFDRCRERFVFNRLKHMLKDVEVQMNNDEPKGALTRMNEVMSLCQIFLNKNRLVDFSMDAVQLVKNEYMQKLENPDHGMKLGWESFDKMTGGLGPGDVVAIVGRPGSGKTYLGLHASLHNYLQKKVPMFVSMEMKPLPIVQRVAAMVTKLPITPLKHAKMANHSLLNMMEQLSVFKDAGVPFYVVDGGLTATIDEVTLMAQNLRPDLLVIDGAYLLRSSNPKLARWDRQTENAERIKQELAEQLEIPVIITYQYNRKVGKKTKAGEGGLEDIAYTDAIGQLSSVVLGLLKEEDVETLTKRKIEILKGRNGESGSFEINWSFDQGPNFMDFSEIEKNHGDILYQ